MKRIIIALMLISTLSKADDIAVLVASTIYLEAGGESHRGKEAVAAVIYNRAKGNLLNFTPVITDKWQFSCWNHRNPYKYRPPNNKTYRACFAIALKMINGTFTVKPEFRGLTHYHNTTVYPYWARSLYRSQRIGQHIFYRNKALIKA
jgi:spore germination cell wall hydrolase CwlJ-like protein